MTANKKKGAHQRRRARECVSPASFQLPPNSARVEENNEEEDQYFDATAQDEAI
jgi:hypothetical protein